MLGALYTLSLIDRTNIGGARISGLDEAVDLEISNRASIISKARTSELFRRTLLKTRVRGLTMSI